MEQLTVSVCHSLKIIPVVRLTRFARFRSRVILITVGTPDDAAAVPGSVKISTTADKGIIKKKITFDRSGVSDSAADIRNHTNASVWWLHTSMKAETHV